MRVLSSIYFLSKTNSVPHTPHSNIFCRNMNIYRNAPVKKMGSHLKVYTKFKFFYLSMHSIGLGISCTHLKVTQTNKVYLMLLQTYCTESQVCISQISVTKAQCWSITHCETLLASQIITKMLSPFHSPYHRFMINKYGW